MTLYSNQRITSYNRSEYCPVNTQLKIISTSGLVAIVSTCAGEKFPCLVEMLSENEVVVLVKEDIIESEPVINDQLRLF